ncbi:MULTISPECIES: NAD-dependent dehydratase [unclassified Janthinobacterium]|uniref:NAD-dependent dehydratase n=1 Tax=unclassified Janthinobacterium TaxID=2610881 RepID=UPI001E2CA5E3|nr:MULTISPECIES: NAD-dependent dehydratase [unclassified Janthinobacterium]MCC7642704.1 NAD-dependent dehydratase [Janthinobacterium sp. EB271-G4-3-1]MCC7689723.1 NAD-dependent dehydratase [Janthinobacterium sp. EB271-G4-3-2]
MKLILIGATGLVGREVLRLALMDKRVTAIVAPVRKPLPAHPKLDAPLVDFDRLPADAPWWQADAVICTLGTTMKAAGTRQAFRSVDHDYPLAAARLALATGTRAYALNSAAGANAASRFFYNRVKGDLEGDLEALGFASLTHVRPGLIGGEREEVRAGEGAALRVLRVLGPVLPRRWRINPAPRIASALLEAALAGTPGVHVVGPEQLA